MSITLYPFQKTATKFAIKNNFVFIEAPTGSGKSVMISYLAHYYNKQGKKVIVSTSTNQLALELLKKIKSFKRTKAYIDIVIGKNNYLDLEKIDLELLSKFTDVKEVIKELNNLTASSDNKDYIIDVFLDKLDLDEESKELLARLLSTSNKKEYIKDFNEVDIAVTNHFYLILNILFQKKNFDEYIFLIDEVHQISEAMEAIFSDTFSLFRFRYLLKSIIQNVKFLEFKGQKTLLKRLLKVEDLTDRLFQATVSEKKIGLSFINDKKEIKVIKKIIKILTKEEIFKTIEKLKKINLPDNKLKELLIEEYQELLEISKVNEKDIVIYYSPQKGYPKLSATKAEYYLSLKVFWNKIKEAKCFSATLTIPDNDDYYIKRLNIQKEVNFYKISPIFSKEQITYTIIDKHFPPPKTTESEVDLEWIKAIGDFIENTFENKNSLVLMGGFLEVDNLYEYLEQKGLNTNIIKAERKKSAYRIIERFKKEGGILIATRNYGTGIDLQGELLEKLYITKLPYPVIGTKKWMEMIQKDRIAKTSKSYFLATNEMLLNLKQWVGRLIRSKEDKGDIYILDSRANKINIKTKIIKLIENMFL